jgi:hypothetical protein
VLMAILFLLTAARYVLGAPAASTPSGARV